MLSERDRRTLAEIEQHLREDVPLQRALDRGPGRGRWNRWTVVLLVVSTVLMIAMAGLGAYSAAGACALLAAGAAVVLWWVRRSAIRVE